MNKDDDKLEDELMRDLFGRSGSDSEESRSLSLETSDPENSDFDPVYSCEAEEFFVGEFEDDCELSSDEDILLEDLRDDLLSSDENESVVTDHILEEGYEVYMEMLEKSECSCKESKCYESLPKETLFKLMKWMQDPRINQQLRRHTKCVADQNFGNLKSKFSRTDVMNMSDLTNGEQVIQMELFT